MTRLQSIENALISINDSVFQELCDSFLAVKKMNYSAFSRVGSQTGKQKSIKGTPDSLFLLPSGKYIYVEYSTNISDGIKKIQADIAKCLDSSKTGIPINEIAEIIICVNFRLNASQIEKLRVLILNTRILLSVYTLDSLALELQLNHRDLVNQYLGLPLDTGQIVSINKFVDEYNRASQSIATPLNNIFIHREAEIDELILAIEAFDFVIITGAAGVGKTKLSIQGIQQFIAKNTNYMAYCISNKHHDLYPDLLQYLSTDKDCILFVDDANRIDTFRQIIGVYKFVRTAKLKIIITVRDYAFQDVFRLCQEFNVKRIDLQKLSDEQIIDIIQSESFKIFDIDDQKNIVRISDGNPRLAVMTALLTKEKQSLYDLSDVSELFEKYFSTFVRDNSAFSNHENIKYLGLISFFYTLPYKDRSIIEPILGHFNLKYENFIDSIDVLEKLEIVGIQIEHVKISEQNLATYFFYRCFIKDRLLSFGTLLEIFFYNNSNRFIDSVIPAYNMFGGKNMSEQLHPELKKYLAVINNDNDAIYKFLGAFWFNLQLETIDFLYEEILRLPESDDHSYTVTYKHNEFVYDHDRIISLIGEFYWHNLEKISDCIELGFKYVEKKPSILPEFIHKIQNSFAFNREDEGYDFYRQQKLLDILVKGLLSQNNLFVISFYELSKIFLPFRYTSNTSGRHRTIVISHYTLPNINSIRKIRALIWDTINSDFKNNSDKALDILKAYMGNSRDVDRSIMDFDIPYIVRIIKNNFDIGNFDHCLYTQNVIRWFRRNSLVYEEFENLIKSLRNPEYEIFLKIDWNQLRDKEDYEFDNYQEYEKLKEEEIRKSFIFSNGQEARDFYVVFLFLKGRINDTWNYNRSLELILIENAKNDITITLELLQCVIEDYNQINYVPGWLFKTILNNQISIDKIWNLMISSVYIAKTEWLFSFFGFVDETFIDATYIDKIISTAKLISERTNLRFEAIERFLKYDRNLFQKIVRIIIDKNQSGIEVFTWIDFFNTYFEKLGDDIKLIEKAYLQQDNLQRNFDYEGKGLLKILSVDPEFIISFVENVFKNERSRSGYDNDLGFVWQIKNIEPYLNVLFDRIIELEPYLGILEHFGNAFFINIKPDLKDRADDFLISYTSSNFEDTGKMNVIVDIVRHAKKDLFERVLLHYLDLTQDRLSFSRIWWRGNGGSIKNNETFGDQEAGDWYKIQQIVNKSELGFKLTPIKTYIAQKIDNALLEADLERKRRFLERR